MKKKNVVLVYQTGSNHLFNVCQANTGVQRQTHVPISEVTRKYSKISMAEAEGIWIALFNATENKCIHIYR